MQPWEERFVREYRELRDRLAKLDTMLKKWEDGNLDFEPACSYELLERQAIVMREYIEILEERAEIEGLLVRGVNPSEKRRAND